MSEPCWAVRLGNVKLPGVDNTESTGFTLASELNTVPGKELPSAAAPAIPCEICEVATAALGVAVVVVFNALVN